MASRWTAEEHKTLVSMLQDGVLIQSLCTAIPNKTEGAIVTRARKQELGLNFRTSRRDGRLYEGVSRRDRTNRKEAIQIIVGEKRVATTTHQPTTSETITTESDEIVAEILTDSKTEGLLSYEKAQLILNSNNLPIEHEMVCQLASYILQHKVGAIC